MPKTEADATSSTAEDVFGLLKRRGALCVSQLSVELLISPKAIRHALAELQELELVEHRPDRDEDLNRIEDEIPWAIRRPF
jgi:predicted ArsR family transcriptional regulator